MPRCNPFKQKATTMRDAGYSYNMISEKLGVTKSTLSNWFKNRPFMPNKEVLGRVRYAPARGGAVRHNRRMEETNRLKERGRREVGNLTKRDLWMLGLGLYIGEGNHSYEFIRFINSSPRVIKFVIKWFKVACNLKNENITITIHLYPDNDIVECIAFWKRVTGLPGSQFRKTQIDRRQDKSGAKKRKLPYGTAHLHIINNGDPEKGVRLYRRMRGWIEGVLPAIE